jgi:hypothetical protein
MEFLAITHASPADQQSPVKPRRQNHRRRANLFLLRPIGASLFSAKKSYWFRRECQSLDTILTLSKFTRKCGKLQSEKRKGGAVLTYQDDSERPPQGEECLAANQRRGCCISFHVHQHTKSPESFQSAVHRNCSGDFPVRRCGKRCKSEGAET